MFVFYLIKYISFEGLIELEVKFFMIIGWLIGKDSIFFFEVKFILIGVLMLRIVIWKVDVIC